MQLNNEHPSFSLLCDYNTISYTAIEDTFNATPERLHEAMSNRYNELYQADGYQAANLFFTRLRNDAQHTITAFQHEDEIKERARRYAIYCRRLCHKGDEQAAFDIAKQYGVDVPDLPNEQAQLKRLCNPEWWTRQLIRKQDRETEYFAIRSKLVNANHQPYVSDELLARILARHQRAMAIMERMEVVNESGDCLDMADVVKGSLANPAVRRAELMTRLNGFEQYAESLGHIAEFYTITAPSKYHANSDKYNGATPKDTSAYLQKVWARIRARLDRDSIRFYGMRIAEPHADATPHYHLLLFMQPCDRVQVREIMRHYALQEDGDEAGAIYKRFGVTAVDKGKGSAVGYAAKYISKNVDGFGMDDETDDETGSAISETAKRVRAWASTWGIRQFQQVGGASVGVWRELRRLRNDEKTKDNPTLEAARQAADKADWCEYLKIQNAANTPLRKQLIKVLKQDRMDEATGELNLNQYDEVLQDVVGLWFEDASQQAPVEVVTRSHRWVLQFKEPNCDHSLRVVPERSRDAVLFALASGASSLPWSPENNCTQTNQAASQVNQATAPQHLMNLPNLSNNELNHPPDSCH